MAGRTEMVSMRMPAQLVADLERAARRGDQTRSALIQRYVEEGLRRDRHPRITFKDGPGGRRAAIVGGPDVWELVGLLDDLESRGDDAVAEAAKWFSVPIEDVRGGVAYAAEFADEVRARVELNRQILAESEAAWQAQQDMLG